MPMGKSCKKETLYIHENKKMREQISKLNEHKSMLEERVAAQADIITRCEKSLIL
jgi:hypothetical protein